MKAIIHIMGLDNLKVFQPNQPPSPHEIMFAVNDLIVAIKSLNALLAFLEAKLTAIEKRNTGKR